MILNGIEVEVLASIELIDAYNKNISNNFITNNVIYCIHNNINNKNYIGQTVNFKNRFSSFGHFGDYNKFINGELSYKKILYDAWKKYGFELFTVYIIDTGKDRDDLNKKEIYWIKTLHTCIKDPNCHGYNITWGGDDISNACHTPEAFAKGNKTKEERYGHRGFINAFTPEANEKRRQTNLRRYGTASGPGVYKEAIDKMVTKKIEMYGDPMGACNLDPEKRIKACKISNCFIAIKNNQNVHKSTNLEQYIITLITRISATNGKIRLLRIKEFLSDLREDNRWNQELELIFKDLDCKSVEEIENLVDTISKKKTSINISKALKEREPYFKINKTFNLINRYIDRSNSWEEFGNKIVESCGKHLSRAKEKLINLINFIPELKKDSRWTDKLEKTFGELGEKEINKINSLGRGNKKL